MSIEAMSWALNDAPDLPPSCLAVLIGLANHANPIGRAAFPGRERLAHYARKTVRAVQNDLNELEKRGLIRRGDQRHVLHLPSDRRPVVWDLAMERRRPVPGKLDPYAEPAAGRPTEVPEPVDNREEAQFPPQLNRREADFPPVSDRGEAQYRAGGSTVPSGVKPASHEPSLNRQEPKKRARPLRGAAPPTEPGAGQCPKHRGSPAHNCGPCRAEEIGGTE